MTSKVDEPAVPPSLRMRALSQITGASDSNDARINSSAALAVLHDLASSPATAGASIKLLHELQVHQVELDLQEEELRRAVTDLESALFRQLQVSEFSPAGLFTIERSTALVEINRLGAQMLGHEREALVGRPLDGFLDPESRRALQAALGRVADGAPADGCTIRFSGYEGAPQAVYASVGPDPAGGRFLVACVEKRELAGVAST